MVSHATITGSTTYNKRVAALLYRGAQGLPHAPLFIMQQLFILYLFQILHDHQYNLVQKYLYLFY